jgi:hypothetical protein
MDLLFRKKPKKIILLRPPPPTSKKYHCITSLHELVHLGAYEKSAMLQGMA